MAALSCVTTSSLAVIVAGMDERTLTSSVGADVVVLIIANSCVAFLAGRGGRSWLWAVGVATGVGIVGAWAVVIEAQSDANWKQMAWSAGGVFSGFVLVAVLATWARRATLRRRSRA